MLQATYYLAPTDPVWVSLKPPPQNAAVKAMVMAVPTELKADMINASEELDGYFEKLDHRELFLFSLLFF